MLNARRTLVWIALLVGGFACSHDATSTPPSAAPPGGAPAQTSGAAVSPTLTTKGQADLIALDEPSAGQLVQSPLRVRGRARGGWFFEADFPVHLVDANGKVLVSAPAAAQGEWMTPDYVAFQVELQFTAPTTPDGWLVLEKSNASGLPEHEDSLRVPVRFVP